MVDGLVEANVSAEAGCAFIALRTHEDQVVGLAIPPKGMHYLALTLLTLLGEGTSRGIFPPQLHPMMQPTTNLQAGEAGIEVEFDLSNGLRIASEMPWSVAREFAEKMLALCDANDASPSSVN